MKKKIIVTGCCGFIGFHLIKKYLSKGYTVYGIDNFQKTYDKKYKTFRLLELKKNRNFHFYKLNISKINKIKTSKIDLIIHLAGEAGVRESIDKPIFYINQNISNTISVFEYAVKNNIKNIFYASSSSVYGNCNIYPSSEKLNVNKPISIYGLSKKSCEDIAYYYNFIYKINTVGFRFFTVYGPIGRPDMSMNIFIKNNLNKKIINLNNNGLNYRDYTFVGDIVEQIYLCSKKIKKNKNIVFNIGGEKNIRLDKLVKLIEKITGIKSKIKLKPRIKLDPIKSLASNNEIKKFTGFKKTTSIEDGVKICVDSFKLNKF